jgi:anaerobic selenocysteine-containing dehydrogenase
VQPDRDVRPFQDVLLDLGVKLELPGMVNQSKEPLYKNYADYIQQHQRRPGVGPLAGFRGNDKNSSGRGSPNNDQIEHYKKNGGFWSEKIPSEAEYFKPWNKAYQEWAVKMGLFDSEQPFVFQIYLEPLAKLQRHRDLPAHLMPSEAIEERVIEKMDPLPIWWPNIDPAKAKEYPYHAVTQRPAAMYHSWGSQNIWLRQIHGSNKLFLSSKIWRKYNFREGDWAKITSETSSITVPVTLMKGQNEDTIWTWNAVGKRSGTWGLEQNVDEAKKGFLINHLISDLLPEQQDGFRWSNSDPITGQAAWYDLMVKIEKVENKDNVSLPQFPTINSPIETGKSKIT